MKKLLGRDPKKKDDERDRDGEAGLAKPMKLVLTAEEVEEGSTKESLQGIDPELRRSHPKRSGGPPEDLDRAEQEDENNHWQHMSEKALATRSYEVSPADHRREDKRSKQSAKRDLR